MNKINPYILCPTLKSRKFTYRLVEESDAKDLLACYSDIEAVKLFNSDNCKSNFHYVFEEEVLKLIKFWLKEYSEGGYVRFVIVDKCNGKAIGTIEIFAKKEYYDVYGKVGMLRLDLCSRYETIEYLTEIIDLICINFGEIFEIKSIITKAILEAGNRISVLNKSGFTPIQGDEITRFDNYYVKLLD